MPNIIDRPLGDQNLTDNVDNVVRVQRTINWDLLMERRPAILAALGDDSEFNYLLLPEVTRLLNTTKDTQDRFAIATLWYTGVRVSELLQLRREDLNIKKADYGFVTIKSLKKRNQKPARVIELEDPFYIDLAEIYIKNFHVKKGHFLFRSKRDARKPIDRSTIYRRIKKLGVACNFPIEITPHTMRHSFAINALLHDMSIKTVQTWLGHVDSRTTEIYLKVLSGDVGFKMKNVQFR